MTTDNEIIAAVVGVLKAETNRKLRALTATRDELKAAVDAQPQEPWCGIARNEETRGGARLRVVR
jgi:anti-sigma-K factor RskA